MKYFKFLIAAPHIEGCDIDPDILDCLNDGEHLNLKPSEYEAKWLAGQDANLHDCTLMKMLLCPTAPRNCISCIARS